MILMIHGAGATSLSFNYISLWLDQELQTIDYKVGESMEDIFKRIENPDEVTYILGHSYGGLVGATWLDRNPDSNVKGLITIASPWQGSPTARILNWFLSDPVWHDMKPGSELLKAVNDIQLELPVKNLIANPEQGGNGLADQKLREGIKVYSDWPTIPQLYVKNEFVGGCDIIKEMFESGELAKLLESKNINFKAKN